MRYICLMVLTLPLWGQRLHVSSGSAAPGQKASLDVTLDCPAGKEVVALQWEVSFPGQVLAFDGKGSTAGAAAAAAGKTLTCASRKKDGSTWICILIGGQKAIGNGSVATLRYQIQPNATAGAQRVLIDNVQGVSAGVKKVAIARAAGSLTVSR